MSPFNRNNMYRYDAKALQRLIQSQQGEIRTQVKLTAQTSLGAIQIAAGLYNLVERLNFCAIGGIEHHGILIASALLMYFGFRYTPMKQFSILKTMENDCWIKGNCSPGDHVIIVDDVLNTGCTMESAIRKCIYEKQLNVVATLVVAGNDSHSQRLFPL